MSKPSRRRQKQGWGVGAGGLVYTPEDGPPAPHRLSPVLGRPASSARLCL